MASLEILQRAVQVGLHPQFQPEPAVPGVLTKQFKDLRRQAVRAGPDDDSYHVGHCKSLIVEPL